MTTTERFVADEAHVAILDTETGLAYHVLSIKTARLFADEFNKDHEYALNGYTNASDWEPVDAHGTPDSDETLWDIAAPSVLTAEEIAKYENGD